MVNILVVTHGPLAAALKESSAMFFGDAASSIATIGLFPSDSPEKLKDRIEETIEKIDDGSGVMVLVDIYGGSPFNMVAMAIGELNEKHRIECYTGVNMPLLMEALASRQTMTLEEMRDHLAQVIANGLIENLRTKLDI